MDARKHSTWCNYKYSVDESIRMDTKDDTMLVSFLFVESGINS